jgi:acyl-CoA thioester hydrolase
VSESWPVEVALIVQWGDMDAFQHVNNTVFLRWFESARIAYFEKVGMPTGVGSIASANGAEPGPILARATVDFRQPVTFPDRITARARVAKVGNTSFTMLYQVYSEKLAAVVGEGEGVVVMFDYAKQTKVPVSDDLRARIAKLEGSAHAP